MKNVLITGANFNNKGAQAMLFVTANEIRIRYPNATIYYTTSEKSIDRTGFLLHSINKHTFLNALEMKVGNTGIFKGFLRASFQSAKSLAKRNFKEIYSDYRYINLIESLDLILNVSGFNLSSLFSIKSNDYYLKIIDHAQKCNIPIFLLPQSFGPFDYSPNNSQYIPRIREILEYPELIFTREKEGYDLLTRQLGLKNVILSNDLVLQNRKIDWRNLYEPGNLPKINIDISTENNVAIVPNQKIIDKCPHIDIFHLYQNIISVLLQKNKNIYLIYHSSEDYRICKTIKKAFFKETSVILLQQELSCYDYEEIISRFDYAIASRFHSLVHAFKQNIPCLGLGWAVKYQELFNNLSQQDYILDMRSDVMDAEVLECLEKLDQNYQSEKKVIEKKLKAIQNDNCFDKVFDELEGKDRRYEQRKNIR